MKRQQQKKCWESTTSRIQRNDCQRTFICIRLGNWLAEAAKMFIWMAQIMRRASVDFFSLFFSFVHHIRIIRIGHLRSVEASFSLINSTSLNNIHRINVQTECVWTWMCVEMWLFWQNIFIEHFNLLCKQFIYYYLSKSFENRRDSAYVCALHFAVDSVTYCTTWKKFEFYSTKARIFTIS